MRFFAIPIQGPKKQVGNGNMKPALHMKNSYIKELNVSIQEYQPSLSTLGVRNAFVMNYLENIATQK